MHLYGHGWKNHPRFSRYACGPVEHGEELNKAYQAARWNLHLNITQGMHQRVWEITAAGATPLFRTREPVENDAEPSLSVLRHWAARLAAGGRIEPEAHDGKTGEWLFRVALNLARRHPDAAADELSGLLMQHIQTLMSSRPDVVIGEWDRLTFSDRDSLIARIRSEPPRNLHLHA